MSYIKREAALKVLENSMEYSTKEFGEGEFKKGCIAAIKDDISNISHLPIADVVEVVRCKDCKYFVDEDETDRLGLCTCQRIAIAYNGELYPERNHFCSYGERK